MKTVAVAAPVAVGDGWVRCQAEVMEKDYCSAAKPSEVQPDTFAVDRTAHLYLKWDADAVAVAAKLRDNLFRVGIESADLPGGGLDGLAAVIASVPVGELRTTNLMGPRQSYVQWHHDSYQITIHVRVATNGPTTA